MRWTKATRTRPMSTARTTSTLIACFRRRLLLWKRLQVEASGLSSSKCSLEQPSVSACLCILHHKCLAKSLEILIGGEIPKPLYEKRMRGPVMMERHQSKRRKGIIYTSSHLSPSSISIDTPPFFQRRYRRNATTHWLPDVMTSDISPARSTSGVS